MSLLAKPVPKGAIWPKGVNDTLLALNSIQPGQMIVYHCGRLSDDRQQKVDGKPTTEARECAMIGDKAYMMATTDLSRKRPILCHLTQFRLDDYGHFAYVATGTSRASELRQAA